MSEVLIDFERRLARLEAAVNGCHEVSAPHDLTEKPLIHELQRSSYSVADKTRVYEKPELMKLRGLVLKENHACPLSLQKYHELKTEFYVPAAISRVVSFDPYDTGYMSPTSQRDTCEKLVHQRYPTIYTDADMTSYSVKRDEKMLRYEDEELLNNCVSSNLLMTCLHGTLTHREQAGKSARRKLRGVDQNSGPLKDNGKVEYQYGLVVRSPGRN